MLYSADAARHYAGDGTTAAAMAFGGIDYANMVFANNGLNVVLRLVHLAALPAAAEHNFQWRRSGGQTPYLSAVAEDPTVRNLRAYHGADLVLAFVNDSGTGWCGRSWSWLSGYTAADMFEYALAYSNHWCDGMGVDPLQTLAHEIGHTMGAQHDPASATYPTRGLYPYGFGHRDNASRVETLMAIGAIIKVPYFSTVRLKPNGWTLGIVNQRENEEVLLRTRAALAGHDGRLPAPATPAAPTDLSAVELGGDSVELRWADNANNEDGYQVHYRGGGTRVSYTLPADTRSETVSGLELGVEYEFRVRATVGGWLDPRQLRSAPARQRGVGPIGRPLAPSGLTAKVKTRGRRPDVVKLAWSDNSDDEDEFRVRYRKLGGGWLELEPLSADTTAATARNLEAGQQYRLQVEARNAYGRSATDKVTVQMPD